MVHELQPHERTRSTGSTLHSRLCNGAANDRKVEDRAPHLTAPAKQPGSGLTVALQNLGTSAGRFFTQSLGLGQLLHGFKLTCTAPLHDWGDGLNQFGWATQATQETVTKRKCQMTWHARARE